MRTRTCTGRHIYSIQYAYNTRIYLFFFIKSTYLYGGFLYVTEANRLHRNDYCFIIINCIVL